MKQVLIAVLTLLLLTSGDDAATVGRICDGPQIWSAYRFFDPSANHYFYTIDEDEKKIIQEMWPDIWIYEKEAFCVYNVQASGMDLKPVFRFYSDTHGVHFFTISETEKDIILETYPEEVWRYEGIAWYAWAGKPSVETASTAMPVYRFWSDRYNGHFFTTDEDEKSAREADPNWRYEGIAYYALAGESEVPEGVEVSPLGWDFGTINPGAYCERTITLTNNGEDLTTVFELTGLPASGFSLVESPSLPFLIEPGGTVSLRIRFASEQHGRNSANLGIETDDPYNPVQYVSCTGNVRSFNEFGFHLNPVMLNGSFEGGAYREPSKSIGAASRARFFSYETPVGTRHVKLPLAASLSKAYPTDEDYKRMKAIGDIVVSNIWLSYWDDAGDRPEMEKIIDRCAGYGLLLIVRLEDQSRISNYPTPGPSDDTWFTEVWEPYVRSIVEYGKGKVFAYQVGNEVWEPSRYMLGPTGEKISNGEYIDFLARTRELILSIDPGVDVYNSALTSIVESGYNPRVKDLLDMDIEDYTNIFNFHYFPHGEVDFDEFLKLLELSFYIDDDVIITECNHIDPEASDQDKYEAIMDVMDEVSGLFSLRGTLAFAWNAGTADQTLLPWVIKDTSLEQMLYDHFN